MKVSDFFKGFFEVNKNKSFLKNIKRYQRLDYNNRCKTLSSFLTYLFIYKGMEGGKNYSKVIDDIIIDILGILNELVLYKIDKFPLWFLNKIKRSKILKNDYNNEKREI